MDDGSLKSLHTALIDAINGYRQAQRDAEKPELKALFKAMEDLHQRAHGEVHDVLGRRREAPSDEGSVMSTVHETVIAVRAAVTGLDAGSLSSFASGEERIVKQYDTAIEDNRGDDAAVAVLTRQRSALSGKIAEMKGIATG